jgi:hypothetical protein
VGENVDKYVSILKIVGANGITQATPTYFFIAFVIIFWEIFFKYFSKKIQKDLYTIFKFISYYFIKVYVKILAKNVIFKKIEIHLQVLLLLTNKHYNV